MFILTKSAAESLAARIDALKPDRICVLTDTNTRSCCLPRISGVFAQQPGMIEIPAGERYKSPDTLAAVWGAMSDAGMTRNSLLICLGGGMVCDLGGFAAATFKRGIRRINIPTTLLAAVDASAGGKTAINFRGVKNEVGLFSDPECVLISTEFLATLPDREFVSGYGEMVKHAFLISDAEVARMRRLCMCAQGDIEDAVRRSVSFKASVVAQDMYDHGWRHILNLGHTAGHAFEALALARGLDLSHGAAVGRGLGVSLILSRLKMGFPAEKFHAAFRFLQEVFGTMPFTCDDYQQLTDLMLKDKKNTGAHDIDFVLLQDFGMPVTGIRVTASEVGNALDIYRDMTE